MPKRTNLFQQIIAVLHEHMSPGAEVEESSMLVDARTGQRREVDVVVRTEAAGYPVTVSVEANSSRRPADIEWVDRLIEKHRDLSTDKLVLVSQAGFTEPARKSAESKNAIALSPEDLTTDDPAGEIVNHLKSLWPKFISLRARSARIFVVTLTAESSGSALSLTICFTRQTGPCWGRSQTGSGLSLPNDGPRSQSRSGSPRSPRTWIGCSSSRGVGPVPRLRAARNRVYGCATRTPRRRSFTT